ncbi:hypothetical protein PENPOL_c004G10209 [Penicillium polonicum]|uniref:Uncharacterized protein n=1 Tax=Penicillium polonicum TaxID=60169 RepID=A0A1V6NQC1_PENPO|nr:hypothetical protein PENPOL_c004G10209 [Penicillium polonicum]
MGPQANSKLAVPAATARSVAQVNLGSGLDANGLPIFSRLSGSVMDQLWARVDPQRPAQGSPCYLPG